MAKRVLSIAVLVAAAISVLSLLTHKSKEDEALEERAVTEVMSRVWPKQAFATISDSSSRKFYATNCAGDERWPHKAGVTEFIDVIKPVTQRVQFNFCVNTDTWEIAFDSENARQVLVDDTDFIRAQSRCFALTDSNNRVRERLIEKEYGQTFLRVTPSGDDTTAEGFYCTSDFELKGAQNATWRLWPNASQIPALIPDTPFTPTAKNLDQELRLRKIRKCQDALHALGRDKALLVRATFGESPGLVVIPWGTDRDDPKLTCDLEYRFGERTEGTEKSAIWSMLANQDHPELQAENEEARTVDNNAVKVNLDNGPR